MKFFQKTARHDIRPANLAAVWEKNGQLFDFDVSESSGQFQINGILDDRIISLLEKNRDCIIEMLLVIGQIDMAISIASYRESLPFYCVPVMSKEHVVDYRGVYHLLLTSGL